MIGQALLKTVTNKNYYNLQQVLQNGTTAITIYARYYKMQRY